jgi:hypothetical protein
MKQEFESAPEVSDAPEITPAAADDIEVEHKRRSRFSTALLGVLAAVAVGGVYMMYHKSGPASASAAQSELTMRTMLDDSARNVTSMKTQQAQLEKTVEAFKQFPAAAQVSLDELTRDPFNEPQERVAPSKQAADRNAEQIKSQAIARVQTLKLNSIVYAEKSRSCLINGRFRAEGDSFEDFVIDRINPDGVIVRHAGMRFLIQVQR